MAYPSSDPGWWVVVCLGIVLESVILHNEQPLCSSRDHGSIFSCNLPGPACQAVPYCSLIIELILYVVLRTRMPCWFSLFAPGGVRGQHPMTQIMSCAFKHSKRTWIPDGSSEVWEQILSGFSVGDGDLLGHPWSFIKIQMMLKNKC